MKYPPKHHQENDRNHLIEVIKAYPLATVISVKEGLPLITHLPLIFENNKLIGHIDLYNPQTELLKDLKPVTILFSGPQCYISPSLYTTEQFPTWNYIKVHLKGNVTQIQDANALRQSLISMTEFLEAPKHRYILEPNNPRLEANLKYVKLFEIEITHWEGKFKLSQDKHPRDIKNAREALIQSQQEDVSRFLEKIF